jgi:predicted  nucleic acid-binding Zn-ribbon protein
MFRRPEIADIAKIEYAQLHREIAVVRERTDRIDEYASRLETKMEDLGGNINFLARQLGREIAVVQKRTVRVDDYTEMLDTQMQALGGDMESLARTLDGKIDALDAKIEALVAKREIADKITRSEYAALYMEMCDGKKRTFRLEQYPSMADTQMQALGGDMVSLARKLDGKIDALDAKIEALVESLARTLDGKINAQDAQMEALVANPEAAEEELLGGAFGQHRMQQRGSEY